MPTAADRVLERIQQMVAQSAASLSDGFHDGTRQRLQEVLEQSAAVAVRAAAGEDVGLAAAALEASLAAIGREQQTVILAEGRALAMRAALAVISAAVSAA